MFRIGGGGHYKLSGHNAYDKKYIIMHDSQNWDTPSVSYAYVWVMYIQIIFKLRCLNMLTMLLVMT